MSKAEGDALVIVHQDPSRRFSDENVQYHLNNLQAFLTGQSTQFILPGVSLLLPEDFTGTINEHLDSQETGAESADGISTSEDVVEQSTMEGQGDGQEPIILDSQDQNSASDDDNDLRDEQAPLASDDLPSPQISAGGEAPTQDRVIDAPPEVVALQSQFNEDAGREQYQPDQFDSCRICSDDFSANPAIFLNCGHPFCIDCLNSCFRVGLANKQSFPPRCCTQEGIDINLVSGVLHEDLLMRYLMVQEEFTTRHPTFCANKGCSSLFSEIRLSKNVGKFIICHECDAETCVECRQARDHHIGTEQDASICQEIISKEDKELADGQKWKQCPGCKNLVEKEYGCNHMTCECGTEFCYECGREKDKDNSCGCITVPDEDGWHHRLDEDDLHAHEELGEGEEDSGGENTPDIPHDADNGDDEDDLDLPALPAPPAPDEA